MIVILTTIFFSLFQPSSVKMNLYSFQAACIFKEGFRMDVEKNVQITKAKQKKQTVSVVQPTHGN